MNYISLHRYKCLDCNVKIYLKEFKNTGLINCPVCYGYALSYDKPVELLLEKGSTNRKVRYLALYKAKNDEFYIEEDTAESIKNVKNVFDNSNAMKIKLVQHFGIKR